MFCPSSCLPQRLIFYTIHVLAVVIAHQRHNKKTLELIEEVNEDEV
jgi:hypothetical protein